MRTTGIRREHNMRQRVRGLRERTYAAARGRGTIAADTPCKSSATAPSTTSRIIGSGAGGGMAAKVLTEAGADVVMLEAGPMWDPVKDSYMMRWNYDSPRRGARDPDAAVRRVRRARSAAGRSTASPTRTRRAATFDWFRSRMLGGRTNHWGRISLRFGPGRLPPQEPRRPRRRLADHLRRHQAVLRRGRQAGRHLRRQPRAALPQRAGRHLPAAAAAALLRAADQAGVREARTSRASRRGCRS